MVLLVLLDDDDDGDDDDDDAPSPSIQLLLKSWLTVTLKSSSKVMMTQ